ncbi:MAG: hypothetical protein LUG98_01730 [Tannerellaceae bacterium]|nr:hypothetical protein [Tannerellaceae bacterium]
MNSIFNFNRFINYLKRDISLSKGQYIYLFAILLGAYVIALVMYLLFNVSFVMLAKMVLIGSIVFGPSLLEKTITKYNGILEFTFPVSSLERFLTLFVKYVVLLPLAGLGSYYLLTFVIELLNTGRLDKFVEEMSMQWIGFKQVYVMFGFQSIFLLGYLSFERHPFLKTVLSCIVFTIAFAILSGIFIMPRLFQLMTNPGMIQEAFNVENMVNVTTFASAVKEVCKYFIMFLFPVGLWIVGFFKIREKEI